MGTGAFLAENLHQYPHCDHRSQRAENVIMNKIIIAILFIFTVGCDPSDTRLYFENNSTDTIIVTMRFNGEITTEVENWIRAGERKIKPNEKKCFGIFDKWEGEFFRALPDRTINIIVMENYDYHNNPEKWDSLFQSEKYYFKAYSLQDFNRSNWLIKYPNDGFSKSDF